MSIPLPWAVTATVVLVITLVAILGWFTFKRHSGDSLLWVEGILYLLVLIWLHPAARFVATVFIVITLAVVILVKIRLRRRAEWIVMIPLCIAMLTLVWGWGQLPEWSMYVSVALLVVVTLLHILLHYRWFRVLSSIVITAIVVMLIVLVIPWPSLGADPTTTTAAPETTTTAAPVTTTSSTLAAQVTSSTTTGTTTVTTATTAAGGNTSTGTTAGAPKLTAQQAVDKELSNQGWGADDYVTGAKVDPSKDKATAGERSVSNKPILTISELITFLKKESDPRNALIVQCEEATGGSLQEILDPGNWVVCQSLVEFIYPGNSLFFSEDRLVRSAGERSGGIGDVFFGFYKPGSDKAPFFVRGACLNGQFETPRPRHPHHPTTTTTGNGTTSTTVKGATNAGGNVSTDTTSGNAQQSSTTTTTGGTTPRPTNPSQG